MDSEPVSRLIQNCAFSHLFTTGGNVEIEATASRYAFLAMRNTFNLKALLY
jgi:hypothetical protein